MAWAFLICVEGSARTWKANNVNVPRPFFMCIYLLIISTKSASSAQNLEKYLSGLVDIENSEVAYNCYSYELHTNIREKELVRLLKKHIKSLRLNKQDMVVLYDTDKMPDSFDKAVKDEKIILYGDSKKDDLLEEMIIDVLSNNRLNKHNPKRKDSK